MGARRFIAWLMLAGATFLVAVDVEAQFRQRGGSRRGFGGNAAIATPADFDGAWNFCRIVFRNVPDGDGGGWSVDWPRADENLSLRLSELTKTHISLGANHAPNHLLVRLTDPELFDCPFVMMTEPGGAGFTDAEAAGLRTYLLKGGFLWADDFWGDYAFRHWEREIQKALPASEFPIFDVPLSHPLFHTQFEVSKVPQIPNIGFFASGSGTSERGADSAVPHLRGINDSHGRLIVVMTHNTDFGDAFEREGDDPNYFMNFGPPGYAMGINILLYAMTH